MDGIDDLVAFAARADRGIVWVFFKVAAIDGRHRQHEAVRGVRNGFVYLAADGSHVRQRWQKVLQLKPGGVEQALEIERVEIPNMGDMQEIVERSPCRVAG